MCVFSFVPPARPWDAVFFRVFSVFYGPFSPLGCGMLPSFLHGFFHPEVRSNLALLRPALSYPFHTHLPLLLFLCTHGLLCMYSHSHAAACISPLHSFLFNLHGLTHTKFYTNQLLHQPAFTQTLFDTNHFLLKPTFTRASFCTNPLLHTHTHSLFHKPPFTPTRSYTNELLHTPASTQTNFSSNQLLHKPPIAPTNFYKPAFTHISVYTNQLLQMPVVLTPPLTF